MRVEVVVPGLLADCTGGRAKFSLEADTLQGALDRLVDDYPLLKRHLYDESGKVRKHVLLCYNNENIDWLESLDVPLHPGDRLAVMQLVSGG
ncbi:MoaD/ThiS family protein [Cohnella cholangitidis]|uniref:MoaD/ThiS family protein n=1 Tax=Cohnella cholangitidis TaxID=2598458 RepID=A0A7G5C115_9BACL|nr:MoaD/ThiS family protein [Cohnella cholangitidis]QMV42899.1 MoaD/ThiS family protein [Cohnella cholangitidis]